MRLRFADFDLDTEGRSLLRGEHSVALEPRAFDLLAYLVRNADRTVAKAELLRAVWPSVRVTDASVDQAIRSVRRALGDDARAPRFVRTIPRRGVQFIAPVMREASAGRYAGRAPLIAALHGHLEDLAEGRGRIALITGPPGIGKTRTAAELLGWAEERGIACAQAMCRATSTRGCAPWRELAEDLAPAVASERDGADRSALFLELRRAFTTRAPCVLLVEDLHEADESSLEFLESLAGFVPRRAILVVATARGSEHWASEGAARVFQRVAATARVAQLPLAPLDAREVGDLVAGELGTRPSTARCEALAERTEGNPLWIRLLLQGLAPELARDALEPAAQRRFREAIARGLQQAIAQRLTLLDDDASRVLEAAAVLGEEFDGPQSAEVACLPVPRTREALEHARSVGVVERARGPSRWRFAHAAFRDALADRLGREQRCALHLAAARAFERTGAQSTPAGRTEIAQHLVAAGAAGDPARAVELARDAAVEAAAQHALDRAESLLAAAANLLAAAGASVATCCGVWTELAVVRERRMAPGREDAADRALGLAREAGDAEAFARAALARVGPMDRLRLPQSDAMDLLGEALERLAPDSHASRARVMGRLEAETSYSPDRTHFADLHQRALAEGRRSSDVETELFLMELPFGGFWERASADDRLSIASRGVVYAEQRGKRSLALSARFLLALERAARGELGRMGEELDRIAEDATEIGDDRVLYRALVARVMRATALGAFDDSDRTAAQAQALADSRGFPGETLGRAHRLASVIGRGRARDAVAPLRLARQFDAGPGVAALLIHALAVAGEAEACATELRHFAREAAPTLHRYPSAVANAWVVACAAQVVQMPEVAAPLEPLLAPERGRIVTRGLMLLHGPASLALASCAALRGDSRTARALFAEAEELAQRESALTWLADIERLRPLLCAG